MFYQNFKYGLPFFLTILFLGNCSKDDPIEKIAIESNEQIASTFDRSIANACNFPDALCEKMSTIHAKATSGSDNEVLHFSIGQERLQIYRFDGILSEQEYFIRYPQGDFVLTQSINPYVVRNASTELVYPQLATLLASVDYNEVEGQVASKFPNSSIISYEGTNYIDFSYVQGTTLHDFIAVPWCEYIKVSNVALFINEFVYAGVSDPTLLSRLVDQAYQSCPVTGGTCLKCVEPKCVVDALLAVNDVQLSQYSKEIIVCNYLRVMLNLSQQEYDWLTQNRPYATSLYQTYNKPVSSQTLCNTEECANRHIAKSLLQIEQTGTTLSPSDQELLSDHLKQAYCCKPNLYSSTLNGSNATLNLEVLNFLKSHQNGTVDQQFIAEEVAIAYRFLEAEGGLEYQELKQYFANNDPTDPLWEIMKEQLADILTKMMLERLPGGSVLTIGPELLNNINNGNFLEAVYNAVEIAFNEAKHLNPAFAACDLSLGAYNSYKSLKKIYKPLKEAASLGEDFVKKLYAVMRTDLGWSLKDIREKFEWIGLPGGSKIKGVSSQSFWEKLKARFGAGLPVFNDNNGHPVFKIGTISQGNLCIYAALYPDSNSGFAWTIGFYTGPCNATSFGQLAPKFKIRFDN